MLFHHCAIAILVGYIHRELIGWYCTWPHSPSVCTNPLFLSPPYPSTIHSVSRVFRPFYIGVLTVSVTLFTKAAPLPLSLSLSLSLFLSLFLPLFLSLSHSLTLPLSLSLSLNHSVSPPLSPSISVSLLLPLFSLFLSLSPLSLSLSPLPLIFFLPIHSPFHLPVCLLMNENY